MSCKKYLHLLVSLLIIFSSRSVQSGEWSYHIHDHLGNTRVVLDEDGDVKEYYDYYPFGKTLRAQVSGNETIYKFAGKELDGEDDLNWYYFGRRFYDPVIGRWLVRDPLAEKYPQWSPYVYSLDNPINFIDPDGQRPWLAHEKKHLLAALQRTDRQYFSDWGKGLLMNDQGLPASQWPPKLNVQIEGITTYKKMSTVNKIKANLQVASEYLKSLNPLADADPRMNSITGEDPEFGGEINLDIREDQAENKITGLLISDKGGENVIVHYIGKDSKGKILYFLKRTFSREEYNKWREEMNKVRDDERNKED